MILNPELRFLNRHWLEGALASWSSELSRTVVPQSAGHGTLGVDFFGCVPFCLRAKRLRQALALRSWGLKPSIDFRIEVLILPLAFGNLGHSFFCHRSFCPFGLSLQESSQLATHIPGVQLQINQLQSLTVPQSAKNQHQEKACCNPVITSSCSVMDCRLQCNDLGNC